MAAAPGRKRRAILRKTWLPPVFVWPDLRPGGHCLWQGSPGSRQDIPSFPYELLWGGRRIVSVANLTRKDGIEFLAPAPKMTVKTTVHRAEANMIAPSTCEASFCGYAIAVNGHLIWRR
jgi:hypothetical protein